MRIFNLLCVLALAVLVSSCATFKSQESIDTMSVEDLYNKAHTSLMYGDRADATRAFQRLIARFPYGEYNQQAQIELAYGFYKDKKPEEAYSTIDRFISTFPAHKHIDYAYYLRGLINFDRTGTVLQKFFHRDNGSRLDQGFYTQAYNDFDRLVRRFPDSKYTPDARERMSFLVNQLAEHEINVAKFYLRQKAWVASSNRAKYVIENFQKSPQVADALAIEAHSFAALGLNEQAGKTREVLELNYPDHPYLKDPSWPPPPSTLRRMVPFSGHH